MTQRDAALLKRWSEHRDAEAFDGLVSHYADMVYATCKRILGNPSDAEELTQECFLKLAAGDVRIRSSLGGWLHSVATSLSINRIRTDARRRRREEIAAGAAPQVAEPNWDDIQRYVDEAIAELPERLREPLIRHFLQRETHEEIARGLGVSRSTVTKQIGYGIDRVREKLRRKGIMTTATVLAAFASARMAEAAPASLKAGLGRLALSGVAKSAAVGAAGAAVLAKAVAALVVVLIVGAGAVVAYNRVQVAAPPVAQGEQTAPVAPLAATPAEAKPADEPAPAAPSAPAASPAAESDAVSGRVYDRETQKPVAGATVSLRSESGQLEAQTDERGEYRVADAAPGKWYAFCKEANGYYLGLENLEPGSPQVRELTVEAGRGVTGVDFALERGEGVRGVAVDAEGKPVAGAVVTGFADVSQHHIANTAESGEDGSFVVTGFPPTVALFVWAEKGELVSEAAGPYALPQEGRALDPVVLQPEAVLRGVVQDMQGTPLEGLKVVPQFGPNGAYRVRESVSGADGRFEIKGMPPGQAILRVCRDVEIVNNPCPSVALAAGQVVDDLALTCSVGRQSISGRVVDSRGNGVNWAEVNCNGGDPPQQTRARTDGDGSFVLESLAPGVYTLTANHSEHLDCESVEVAAGSTNVRLVLGDPISVEGRVVDDKTGQPVTAYEIKYCYFPEEMLLEQRYEKKETVDGSFKLEVAQLGGIPIAVRAEGYLMGVAVVPVDGTQSAIRNVDIRLKPQADLHGTVRDAQGAPVVGALVFSGKPRSFNDADNYAAARTGDDGGFVLPARKLGHDFILVFHPNYTFAQMALEPRHYAGEAIDVRFEADARLVCIVLANGAPGQGSFVSVWKPGQPGGMLEPRPTGPDGKCVFQTLPPGDYEVSINLVPVGQQASGATQRRQVSLAAGQTTEITVPFDLGDAAVSGAAADLPAGTSLHLVVRNASGEQEYYRFFNEGENANGYSFTGLPAGEATMRVMLEPGGNAASGSLSHRYTFTLAPGANVRQDLRADEGPSLWGTVGPVSPDESAAVQVLFGAFSAEEVATRGFGSPDLFCAYMPVTPDGTFRMDGFQPGTYTLIGSVLPKGGTAETKPRETSVVVELAEPGQEVNLRLP